MSLHRPQLLSSNAVITSALVKTGGPGTEIDIPLAHKDALYARSFYDTLTIAINDAPKPDEILILFAAASRSRLNARLGGLQEKDIIGKDGLR